ncbi:hypothetical protein GF374_03260 [Candidatus Woesearchaeota archaeon]|nr:hypothetical protein [Candidatus Woesearchaeota archaeon]
MKKETKKSIKIGAGASLIIAGVYGIMNSGGNIGLLALSIVFVGVGVALIANI